MADEPTTRVTCATCDTPLVVTREEARKLDQRDRVPARCAKHGCPEKGQEVRILRDLVYVPGVD